MIEVVQGDLTQQRVDAIVNAANEHLQHGGGVAAAIARAGGDVIQRESDAWVKERGPLKPGQAAVTNAGSLPAAKVIHVVGPRYREGQDNPALLAQAVGAALQAAKAHGCRTIAMPAISAGIFGYPRPEACQVIVRAIRDWLTADATAFDQVLLVGLDEAAASDFENALRETDPE
ncbi:MAG TPA: macro domain-containing protein [Acidimicrobiia bacterium]|nr:macro domain-containing protein [Acidimicrobiia bacterium]